MMRPAQPQDVQSVLSLLAPVVPFQSLTGGATVGPTGPCVAGWKLLGFPGARYDYRDWVDRH